MKKQILTIVLAITTLTAFAQVPSYVPTNGLVGYWPFNGNANDESGNGNNGTVNGATLTSDRNGVANKAYSFDGTDDRIIINLINNFPNSTTISVWYKSTSQNGGPFVHIGQDNGGSPHCNGFGIGKGGSSLNNPGNDLISGYSGVGYYDSNVSGAFGQWNHVILTKTNNILNFYLNGTLVSTINTSNVISPTNFVFFGSTSSGFSTMYNGLLDDIAIYNKILNQQEITDLYNSCTNPTAVITTQGTTTFCQGGSVILNASTGTGYTYEWYKDGNIVNGSIGSSYTANQSGSYTVKVINGSCNATSSSTTVTVNPNPTAVINAAGVSTFCQGGSVILNASTGAGNTYEWYKNGNIINGSTTSSYTANQSGSYTVKVINGACNATSSPTTVTVNPNPTVSLSLANFIHIKESPVTLAGSPSGGTYSGVGVVGSTFSSTNAGLGKKTITYNYTTGAGCSGSATAITTVYDTTACSTFDTLFINIAVAGLIAPNNLGTLKIWPNPANDRITIDNGNYGILSGYSVKIETVLGQEVFKSAINQQQFSVDLTTWNGKGVYLVHILDNQNNIIETKKIVLQ